MRQLLLSLVFLLTATLLNANGTFRSFSNKQGQEMQAKLTQVSGDDVYIERRDGLSTKVDIAIFSEEDQKYIREWARNEAIKDNAIEVRFTTDVSDKSRWKSSGGVMQKTWKESFGIVLTNKSYMDLKNIRIDYLLFKFEDAVAAEKRSDGVVRYLTGTTKVPLLKAGDETTATTEKFPMLETKLEPGFSWRNGGKTTSEDDMHGIWIKVYVDDILATEVSKPENLMRKHSWPTSSSS